MSAQFLVKILGLTGVILGTTGIICGLRNTGPMGSFSLLKFLLTRDMREKSSRAQTIGEGIMSLLVGVIIIYYAHKMNNL